MTTPSPTLAALLALLDAREPLDVGPCPACVERGGGWQWCYAASARVEDLSAEGWKKKPDATWHRRGAGGRMLWLQPWVRPCPECSEPGPEVECEGCDGRGSWDDCELEEGMGCEVRDGELWHVSACFHVECPDCGGTGKRPGPPQPTGRDKRTPGQALRDALGLGFEIRHDRKPRAQPREPDPAARTALQVEADRLMSPGPALTGRTPEENLLGQAIALALAGECRECEGKGKIYWPPTWEDSMWDDTGDESPCPKCNGEGSAVGELAAEVRALVSEAAVRRDCRRSTSILK